MKQLILYILFLVLVAGCTTPSPKITDPKITGPKITSYMVNVHLCKHKYDEERNFYYQDQVKIQDKEIFGEVVFLFYYTLLNGQSHFLSGDEVENYICKPYSP